VIPLAKTDSRDPFCVLSLQSEVVPISVPLGALSTVQENLYRIGTDKNRHPLRYGTGEEMRFIGFCDHIAGTSHVDCSFVTGR
jgi:hypothetical protein